MNRRSLSPTTPVFALFALGGLAFGQAGTGGGPNTSGLPADGPRIPRPRMTQADIVGGVHGFDEIRRRGLEMFTTPFNKADGHGDGPVGPDPTAFGERPTTNGTWLRINGLDSQTCLECHQFISNATVPATLGIGGIAGIGSSAFPLVTDFDIGDEDLDGIANVNGRLINPPFLFGSGGVELVGREMTAELQALKAQAQAQQTTVPLVTKGISFGSISHDGVSFNTDNVEGVDDDLVVRPFGRKGEFATVRAFDIGALQFHLGMQTVDDVGPGTDPDGDGVTDEVLVGELSALHIFNTNLDRPIATNQKRPRVRAGRQLFSSIGCTGCHTPILNTNTETLDYSFPEVETDPTQNVFYSANLRYGPAGFDTNGSGGIVVPMFSDLKRHDMGPELAETTGHPLDAFFITPRLWGVGDTAPYLHDGRALTLREAIEMHGGEGQAAADNFASLTAYDQGSLLTFLDSLRCPTEPAKDIAAPRRQ